MVSFDPKLKLDDCCLYIAGHCSIVSSPSFRNETYKLIVVTSGAGKLLAFGTEYPLKERSIVFLYPNEEYSILPEQKDGVLYDFACFTVSSGKYKVSFNNANKSCRVFTDENIANCLNNLCKELEGNREKMSTDLLSLISSQMLVYLLRRFGESSVNDSIGEDANLEVCNKIMSYIDDHIYSMKNLREVAASMGYNYSYISTLFHKTTGTTLNNYFKTKRMEEAKKLLSDSKMTISEIARVMNYSSVYAFSKAFKEHFGASPGHFSGRFAN